MTANRLMLWLPIALLGCDPSGPEPDAVGPSPEVQLTLPASPAAVDDLQAIVASSGLEGVEPVWSWTVDGVAAEVDGPVVPSALVQLGQTWVATARFTDGRRVAEASAEVTVDRVGGNVMIVVVDDVGVDKVGAYGVHPEAPPTPTIDGLAAEGLLFRNLWVQPTCSPSRASLLTGRYPRRTGVGRWIMPPEQRMGIDPLEVILPEILAYAPVSYDDSGTGKWHLTGYQGNEDPAMDPLAAGFSWYAGTLGNPDNSFTPTGGQSKGYAYFEKATNGVLSFESTYLTTDTTDDALARMGQMQEPWLLYVAYNAPHSPLHVPPDHLHGYDLDPDTATDFEKYDAMVEALDTEIGRLLDGLDDELAARTTVILLSDNGSPSHAVRPPLDPERRKGTVYEGGVNVPMIVTGPAVAVPGSETTALVESVDLFHTVAELVGVDVAQVLDPRTGAPVRTDGRSFLPYLLDPDTPSLRDRAYTSKHYPNGLPPYAWTQDALRDEQYKVAYHTDVGMWFFEYSGPFDEGPELLELGSLSAGQQAAYDRLSEELFQRIDSLDFGP